VAFDGTELNKTLKQHQGPGSQVHYTLTFEIVLRFGLTELAAQVCWRDDKVSDGFLAINMILIIMYQLEGGGTSVGCRPFFLNAENANVHLEQISCRDPVRPRHNRTWKMVEILYNSRPLVFSFGLISYTQNNLCI
jgi:hypothetical protein